MRNLPLANSFSTLQSSRRTLHCLTKKTLSKQPVFGQRLFSQDHRDDAPLLYIPSYSSPTWGGSIDPLAVAVIGMRGKWREVETQRRRQYLPCNSLGSGSPLFVRVADSGRVRSRRPAMSWSGGTGLFLLAEQRGARRG